MRPLPIMLLLMSSALCADARAQDGAAIRKECNPGQSHPEVRACLQAKAEVSAHELRRVEDQLRESLAAWDQEAEYIQRSKTSFEKSVAEFARYRDRQCEFRSSLAAGGNSQGDLRLSCIYELNTERAIQVQQAIPALR